MRGIVVVPGRGGSEIYPRILPLIQLGRFLDTVALVVRPGGVQRYYDAMKPMPRCTVRGDGTKMTAAYAALLLRMRPARATLVHRTYTGRTTPGSARAAKLELRWRTF